MDKDRSHLETRISALEKTLLKFSERLHALETSRLPAGQAGVDIQSAENISIPVVEDGTPAGTGLSLADIGRAFLVMAGAFMLRALTNSGTFPVAIGIALGLLYTFVWIFQSARTARSGRVHQASLFGVTAALIAFPLLWEVPTRFKALGPGPNALLLTLVTALALWIAWRERLRSLAWMFTLGGLVTSIALIFASRTLAPYIGLILLLGLITVWMGYRLKWHGLRWGSALAGNLIVLFMVSIASSERGIPKSYSSLTVGMAELLAVALLVIYLGSFVVRTLVRQRDVTQFEVLQSAAALLIGFGGAVRISLASGSGGLTLGAAALVAAVACYFISFVFVDRRRGRGKNFIFFTSLAIVLVFIGSPQVMAGTSLVLVWCLLSIASAYLGGRYDRITLRAHSAFYMVAAFISAAYLQLCLRAFLGPVDQVRWTFDARTNIVLAAALLSYTILVLTQRKLSRGEVSRIPRFLVLVVSFIGLAGLVAGVLVPAVSTWNMGEAVRIVVLSVAAIALAAGGRHRWTQEFAWMVYPVLILGGLKLLLVILRAGDASTLFVGFAFYGTSLIIAPRLLRGIEWRIPGRAVNA